MADSGLTRWLDADVLAFIDRSTGLVHGRLRGRHAMRLGGAAFAAVIAAVRAPAETSAAE